MSEFLIPRDKSVIVAADVPDIDKLHTLVSQTQDVEGIGGYKVGLRLALRYGLPQVVAAVREHTTILPVIYDHQKAGNDIPEMGAEFADVCKQAGVDSVILFPFGGRKTEGDWIVAAQDAGLHVMVGGHMTQQEFLASEGGYIDDDAPAEIYKFALNLGVSDFVVPGNKVNFVTRYRDIIRTELGSDDFCLYAPGFITQGGEISEMAKVAGDRWHAIVGSAIYKAANIREAAELVTSQIR